MNFRIELSIFEMNAIGIFMGIDLNLELNLSNP
jgi:hypothetical protein